MVQLGIQSIHGRAQALNVRHRGSIECFVTALAYLDRLQQKDLKARPVGVVGST